MTRQRRQTRGSADLRKTIEGLYRLSQSEDWSLREEAGFCLRDLIEEHFEAGMALTESWPTDSSCFVRRAACLACMQRKRTTNSQRISEILRRLELVMTDDALYVRKCCGPFVVGYLGYTYPASTLPWLLHMANDQDLNVRANVAKAFSQALGKHHPREGLQVLDRLADDTRQRVRAAVGASFRNIIKYMSASDQVTCVNRNVRLAALAGTQFDLSAQQSLRRSL